MSTKVCSRCNNKKSLNDFYNCNRAKDGKHSICKTCAQKVDKLKYQKRKEKPNAKNYFHNQYLWRVYKLRLKDKQKMYLEQNGCCGVCKKSVSFYDIYIDHNHTTGKVRELLCPSCNTFVGHIENKLSLVEPIIKYLEKYNG